MSMLTEAVLIVYPSTPAERGAIQAHDFEPREDTYQRFNLHDSNNAGGHKVASWDVYQACFNYVSAGEIRDWFYGFQFEQSWTYAVLTIQDEHGAHPEIHTRGTWTPLGRPSEMAW